MEVAGLPAQELEVVVEAGPDLEAPVKARVTGDLASPVGDHHLPRAEAHRHLEPREGHRHRVAVLLDRHKRLGIDARAKMLGGVETLSGQRAKKRPLPAQVIGDRS